MYPYYIKWLEEHREEVNEQKRVRSNERYKNEPEYREKAKKNALARYYRLKAEKEAEKQAQKQTNYIPTIPISS